MNNLFRTGIVFFCWIVFLHFFLVAQEKGKETSPPPLLKSAPIQNSKPAKKASLIRLGPHTAVDTEHRQVILKGEVSLTQGLVEYFACSPDTKDYESILRIFSKPEHIHTALLLVGLKPGCEAPAQPQDTSPSLEGHRKSTSGGGEKKKSGEKPNPTEETNNLNPCLSTRWVNWGKEKIKVREWRPKGDKVYIRVRWKNKEGKEVVHRAEDLLLNHKTKKAFPPVEWVFTGSPFVPQINYETFKPTGKQVYAANETGTIIGLKFDSNVVISWPFYLGARWKNILSYAHTEVLPPAGTKVDVLIIPAQTKKK